MRSAQVAFAVLTGLMLIASVTLFSIDESRAAIVCLGVSIIGWVSLLGMIISDVWLAVRGDQSGEGR